MVYFPESKLAHRYIDPLQPGHGLELGGSAHNTWGIPNTINVDYTDDMTTVFKKEEVSLCGRAMAVDVVAYADKLPFLDSSQDWVISSHVLEHCPDPIRAHIEWHRVIKPGGIIFTHVPKRDAHPPDRLRPLTGLDELVESFTHRYTPDTHPGGDGVKLGHYYVWSVPLYMHMVCFINRFTHALDVIDLLETDDKVGNSHAFVLRVVK